MNIGQQLARACIENDLEKAREIITENPQYDPGIDISRYVSICPEIAMILINNGADTNITDHIGRSPFFYASFKDNFEICDLLLSRGADINAEDNDFRSPLYYACRANRVEMVNFLLSRGANIDEMVILANSGADAGADKNKIKEILDQWPTIMSQVVFDELGLYNQFDTDSTIGLNQYIGKPGISRVLEGPGITYRSLGGRKRNKKSNKKRKTIRKKKKSFRKKKSFWK
jgi:ankyrin repeat protein